MRESVIFDLPPGELTQFFQVLGHVLIESKSVIVEVTGWVAQWIGNWLYVSWCRRVPL